MSACLHKGQRSASRDWTESQLITIHDAQSDPKWVKFEIGGRSGRDLHRLQTYRMAVRQELRVRGLPVKLGT